MPVQPVATPTTSAVETPYHSAVDSVDAINGGGLPVNNKKVVTTFDGDGVTVETFDKDEMDVFKNDPWFQSRMIPDPVPFPRPVPFAENSVHAALQQQQQAARKSYQQVWSMMSNFSGILAKKKSFSERRETYYSLEGIGNNIVRSVEW